ncbi:hypothetical protein CVT24_005622 [Panaeolus cyanescens]|uniref:Uncharacterized protein n=1 Tax=Panaeolus cyanescens TaxID=181874 RepID=A0A409YXX3_9AGAR|nr:hypothetical protein CVT24_005622 [Panaeolus cyanescens]
MGKAKQGTDIAFQGSGPSNDDPKSNQYDGDLNDDLHKALSGDFNFTGTYYHKSVESDAPNPGLTIDGLGLMGSPLSERDVASIVSFSAPAPTTTGRKRPAPKIVEIDPAKVSFANPAWQPFVQKMVTQKVWKSLGLAPFTTMPKCELYKVLLYQKGAKVRPEKVKAKVDDMFATVMIILPSTFEGGQVHISHPDSTAVLDISNESTSNTSVLAWYTDVIQEVKPLTAGCRLTLSYNLIHTSPDTPQPSLPVTPEGPLKFFRDTLQRWKDGRYPSRSLPISGLFAVMLEHTYAHSELVPGLTNLKGRDAFLISKLLPIATEMGFVFCVSSLDRKVTGKGVFYGDYRDNKRLRSGLCAYDDDFDISEYFDEYSDSEDEAEITFIEEDRMSISNVIRVTDNRPVNLKISDCCLYSDALVPRSAFDDLTPDVKDPDKMFGRVEHRYNRSALIVYKHEDEVSILMSISGPHSALQSLPLTKTPNAHTRAGIDKIVSRGVQYSSAVAVDVLAHALLWKDHEIWNRTIPYVDTVDVVQTAIVKAKKVFGLEAILPGLTACLERRGTLEDRLALTNNISTHSPQGMSTPWVQNMINDALVSYSSALAVDVPILLQLALDSKDSLASLATIVIPRTASNHDSYDFHIALAEALEAKKQQMAHVPTNVCQHQTDTLSSLVRQCLLAAGSQWSGEPPPSSLNYVSFSCKPTPSPTVLGERINHLVKLCFSTDNPEVCVEIGKNVGPDRQMDLLAAIETQTGIIVPECVQELMASVLSAYSTPAVSHAPTLSWIAEVLGAEHIETLISTKIPKSGTYEFLFSLAKALQERRSVLLQNWNVIEERTTAFQNAVRHCADLFVSQWEVDFKDRPSSYDYFDRIDNTRPNARVRRILQIVDFSFVLRNCTPCAFLFQDLLHAELSTDVAKRFEEVHTPLVHFLKVTLAKYKTGVLFEPFKSFFKGTICLYLGHILGATPSAPLPAIPATIGCSCRNCERLRTFLDDTSPVLDIQAVKNERAHVQNLIDAAGISRAITYTTTREGNPHTLRITKRPEAIAGFEWKVARNKAIKFIRGIAGDDETLKKLMEERYEDVMKTLSGAKFVVRQLGINGLSASVEIRTPTPVPSSSVATVAGEKRKRSPTITE